MQLWSSSIDLRNVGISGYSYRCDSYRHGAFVLRFLPVSSWFTRNHWFRSRHKIHFKTLTADHEIARGSIEIEYGISSVYIRQSKMTMKFVNEYLRYFIFPHHDDMDSHLPLAEFAYNARVHSTTGMSPFVADLGY
ncbi:unnamed protein product [Phytophthora fragariaefolia]|uniref:Unnamed protein product n=1 Tax=Phytophthora fragariaefolia TaxID=1490495 RepID=A0A9W7D777_9STRA|nr:unnamed protein product [Phytophthora fragariaefolia]